MEELGKQIENDFIDISDQFYAFRRDVYNYRPLDASIYDRFEHILQEAIRFKSDCSHQKHSLDGLLDNFKYEIAELRQYSGRQFMGPSSQGNGAGCCPIFKCLTSCLYLGPSVRPYPNEAGFRAPLL